MVNKQIHEMLVAIADEAYPNISHNKFFIVIENKILKSFHGDWSPPNNGKSSVIRVFNLYRGTNDIVKTSIHELAHNTEYSLYKKTGHSKRFYLIYKQLLETAIKLNIVTLSALDDIDSKHDLDMVIKHHGPLNASAEQSMAYKNNMCLIKVNKSFNIKDDLKNLGYSYNSLEKCWCIEIEKNALDEHMIALNKLTSDENIDVSGCSDLQIKAYGYLIVSGKTFDIKGELKDNGFLYNGFNHSNNVWVKKILIDQMDAEIRFLKEFQGIELSVKNI